MPGMDPSTEAPLEAQRRMYAEAARHLCLGEAVAVPASGGTALCASLLAPEGVRHLAAVANEQSPVTAILTHPEQIFGWLPGLDQRGHRLCRRCWPGEVVIQFTHGWQSGVLQQVPETARQSVTVDGTLALQLPPPSQLSRLAQMVPMPLSAVILSESREELQKQASFVLPGTTQDTAPQRGARLRWDGSDVTIRNPGSFPPEQLSGLTDLVVLFLCSGNTCRSPMAEAMCKTMLAEQLGCAVEDLPRRGIHIMSAGLNAASGSVASPEAVVAAQAYGADMARHASQPLTLALLQDADYIFVMTQQHLRTLQGRLPGSTYVGTLSPEGTDVQDPFGAPQAEYNACAVTIHQHLHAHMPRLLAAALAGGPTPPTPRSAGGET